MTSSTDDTRAVQSGLDRLTRIRRLLLPALHRFKRPFGGFAQCTIHPSEHVGIVEYDLRRLQDELRSMGFHREPIAALKRRKDGRKSAGSWVRRASTFADKQLHVTLFERGREAIVVCAHWEYSWITHPYKHYRGIDWNTKRGVETMRTLLSENDVTFRIESATRG